MKIACVIHRFGADLAGGSEAHCRHVAERLAAHHEVTILTTCAKDHVTWRNEYPAGESQLGALRLRRFPVIRERSLHRFRDISDLAFSLSATEAEETEWFHENGPESPGLLSYLAAHGREFDTVLFWAFRYAVVFFGLPLVADRAVLVPTAEDDPVMGMEIVGRFLSRPVGYVFLTPEEQELVERRISGPLPPSCVVGSGLEPAGSSDPAALAAAGVTDPFVLYLGRIDPNKGCGTLLRHFIRYKSDHHTPLQLVMAGPANMPIPDHPDIKRLGFVDDRTRDALLAHAALLVMPSRFESLSLALLEAWNHATPALVNGHCAVLKGQARRANAALYYYDYDEFARALEYVRQHPDVARDLGRQGLDYVNRHYRWPHVVAQIEDLLSRVHLRQATA